MIRFQFTGGHVRRLAILGAALAAVATLAGCQDKHYLMPTPLVYTGESVDPFATLPPELASPDISVLYLTDRVPKDGNEEPNANARYGKERSRSLAYGRSTVRIGHDATWEEIADASRTSKRSARLEVRRLETVELARFPREPSTLVISDEQLAGIEPIAVDPREAQVEAQFLEELRARLALTPRKDVFVYVHGFNNTFDEAVLTTAELWHFLGREGVPVCYTWPAGTGGLRGYEYTLASTEFTVHNFKKALRLIASCDEVERINILAHSRGTQVTVDTLRELHIETRPVADTQQVLKFGTIILAAADIDLDVMIARNANERIGQAAERVALYLSDKDEALGFSDWLFGGYRRVGSLDPTMFNQAEIATLRASQRLQLINADVSHRGAFGHGYFHANPSVSSDIVLLVRYNLPPGADSGRPLDITDTGLWDLRDGYPGKAWSLPPHAAPRTNESP